MAGVKILSETTKQPLTLMGKMSGICYNSDIESDEKNYKRGKRCVLDGHGRVLEFPQVYMDITGYSARVIREFYTAIGGLPTRLQASTRYINYSDFEYYVPQSIAREKDAKFAYDAAMAVIKKQIDFLQNECNIPKEDVANLLPLGMTTVVSCRFNARTLSSMAAQRLCTRTYNEYRCLMRDIINALKGYSEEWNELCDMIMKCKCDVSGFCSESKSCGRHPKKVLDE